MTYFEQLFDQMDSLFTAGSSSGRQFRNSYPFFNLVKTGNSDFTLEMALAGFAEKDIKIEVLGRTLKISGVIDNDKREYIFKGISTKSFSRTFALAKNVEVAGANLENGMLEVRFTLAESEKPKQIQINSAAKDNAQLLVE